MRELLTKIRSADPALLVVAVIFGAIGIFALVFPSVSISAQHKRWLADTTFQGTDAAFFALVCLTIAYAIGRLAFHQGWKINWRAELPILGAIYGGAFVLYQVANAF